MIRQSLDNINRSTGDYVLWKMNPSGERKKKKSEGEKVKVNFFLMKF